MPHALEAFFLPSVAGRCLATYWRPARGAAKNNLLIVPPFNEEQNRCRSIIATLARALADRGIGAMLIDLHGTGDSDGEHCDARWETWLEDVRCARDWLRAQPGSCEAVLGIRLGALLAAEAQTRPEGQVSAFVGWQPVIDGKTHFTQFLRLRVAAAIDRSDMPKETTTTLRAQLGEGRVIEIGGYAIHPALGAALDARRLAQFPPPAGTRVLWLEHALAAGAQPAPASQALIDQWRDTGRQVETMGFQGEAFWQMHERASADDAIARILAWLSP